MNNGKRKGKDTGKWLIVIIVIMLCAAIGLSIGSSEDSEKNKEYLTEDVKEQTSLELRNKVSKISDTIEISHMKQDDVMTKNYIVRLNHKTDMNFFLKIELDSATDGMAEALNAKVYDRTNDKVIFDDSVKNLDNKVYEELKTANASKKSDTRYEVTLYFKNPVGSQYEKSKLNATLTWYVSEEDAEDLLMPRSGDIKIILYSFIAAIVLIIVLMIFFGKDVTKKIFKDDEPWQLEEPEDKEE